MLFKKKIKSIPSENGSFELVKSLIIEVLDGELNSSLTPSTTFEEIGFDSIKFINLMLSLEDIVNADLEEIAADVDVASIHAIKDVVILVEKYMKN